MGIERFPRIKLDEPDALENLLMMSMTPIMGSGQFATTDFSSQPHSPVCNLDSRPTRAEHDAHEDELYRETEQKDSEPDERRVPKLWSLMSVFWSSIWKERTLFMSSATPMMIYFMVNIHS